MSKRRQSKPATKTSASLSLSSLPTEPVATSFASARLEARDQGILLYLDDTESSFIDLADPAYLDFEYHQHMDAAVKVLLGEDLPLNAVHLGGAACALARAWDATHPGSAQLAVEIDAKLAAYVRQWFDLPGSPRLRIRIDDAVVAAPSLKAQFWDVVVRDIFSAGTVPDSVCTPEFMHSCMNALKSEGLFLINAASAPTSQVQAQFAALAQISDFLVISDAAVARGKRRGNLVLVARKTGFSAEDFDRLSRALRKLPLPAQLYRHSDGALSRYN